jgi:hypothetical protein
MTTIEELHSRHTDGTFPVLIDVQHDYILWSKEMLDSGKYENGHLRLINDPRGVVYQGFYYSPAAFVFSPPSDDGKVEGNASITVSAIDATMYKIIQNMTSPAVAHITTVFEKVSLNEVVFTPIQSIVMEMRAVEWDKLTAKWKLNKDPVLSLNIPRDLGTVQRCPSAN